MVNGIIVCHGQLAHELLKTVQKITGPVKKMTAFSNDQLDAKSLYQLLEEAVAEIADEPVVIMVDLRGGSCWTAAKLLTRMYPDVEILSGINTPMLISFISKRNNLTFKELPSAIELDAHRGIVREEVD